MTDNNSVEARISTELDRSMSERIRGLSRDELERELLLVLRVTKVAEEVGEAFQALTGWLGANPRKGVTNGSDEVVHELLDIAVTVLLATEHVLDNEGVSLEMLSDHLDFIANRMGIPVATRGNDTTDD